jgi:hypothetical protein
MCLFLLQRMGVSMRNLILRQSMNFIANMLHGRVLLRPLAVAL